jgi:LysM repeat protein
MNPRRLRCVLASVTLALGLTLPACGHVWTRVPDTPTPAPPTPTVYTAAVVPTATPTRTPIPATPLATWTPMPTPTPIIYVVQAGDTLIGIAKQFGVTAQFLQDVNAILDPRRLQIGQELLIPPEEPDTGPGLPTATPVPVEVEGTAIYETPSGSLLLLGSVFNGNAEPLERVAVEASLLDAGGEPVVTEWAGASLQVVPAGESSAFAILFSSVPEPFVTFTVRVLSADPMQYYGHFYLDFRLVSRENTAVPGTSVQIRGVAQNTGDSIARCYVTLTGYDRDNRVVAIREILTDPPILGPGETAAFDDVLISMGAPIGRYTVQVQGERLGE